ncbi:transporter associated domain-containing protein [Roseibium sp. RKSG952]|uniref:transporter associated domain-containing protein n=1 Tax=Roseibium sp. RKSG952 TaxID=2529384 RepID=UPI001FCAB570|nr:hemolysin family protein [Roseibium sp. RKSG952]
MTASDTPVQQSQTPPSMKDGEQNSDEPQQSRPQKSAALWTSVKNMLGFNRSSTSLRENLADELARETGRDTAFSPEERMLLGNILRLRELRVDDVMIPRADIDAVENTTSIGRVMELFEESGHSRMPVYDETLDDPRGMVHIKDLIAYFAECGYVKPDKAEAVRQPELSELGRGGQDNSEAGVNGKGHNSRPIDLGRIDLAISLEEAGLIRQLLFVPPSMPATDLMAKMQADRIQMALVIDEYGGTDGLVSLEDLVEEVVGDIEDEHDEDEDDMLMPVSENIWMADPRMPLEDLDEALGTDVASGEIIEDVDTLGGLLYVTLGRVPVRGELVVAAQLPGYEFEILDADPRRIKKIRIRRRRSDVRVPDLRRKPRKNETATAQELGETPSSAENVNQSNQS